jgi:glyoxylase-like metal-dependent hydrolase (beta-lactamase superfamily II)
MAQAPAAPATAAVDVNTHPEGLRKISSHVWAIPDNSVPSVSNIGFVVGSKAVLVIDTGMGPHNGEIVFKEALKLAGNKPLYLVTTHIHPEHDLGAQAFPASVKLIRSETQVQDIAQSGYGVTDFFRRRGSPFTDLLKDVKFRPGDIIFDKTYDLDLGGVKVRLIATGQNHTLGDSVAWVVDDKVLFTGDVAMKFAPSFSGRSSVKHWQATLTDLAALGPAVVVPSHGPFGDAGIIDGYRRYFTVLQTRAAELKRQGKTVEEAVATLGAEQADSLPNARGRLTPAIRSAYAEAD